MTWLTSTNYYCDLCHGPLYKQLGHWWHRWQEEGDKCKGPDRILTKDQVMAIEARERDQ